MVPAVSAPAGTSRRRGPAVPPEGAADDEDAAGGPCCSSLAKWATYAVLAGAACLGSAGVGAAWALASPTAERVTLTARSVRRPRREPRQSLGRPPPYDTAGPSVPRHALAGQMERARRRTQAELVAKTAVFRGQKYFISNNHTFTGPWTEERFYDFWRAQAPDLERIYIPIGWTASEMIHRPEWKRLNDWALNNILAELDTSFDYFTVIQIAKGFENRYKMTVAIPPQLDLLVFATGPTTATRLVPLPLLKEEMSPVGLDKDIKVSFTGTYHAHRSRQAAREMYQERDGWVFEEPHAAWAQTAERSRFVLCPRGWGVTSFRLYEALQLGSVPVYIWADEGDGAGPFLPYQDVEGMDWRALSLVVHESELPGLADRIDALEASGETARLIARVRQTRPMWTYAFMLDYMMHTLRREALEV